MSPAGPASKKRMLTTLLTAAALWGALGLYLSFKLGWPALYRVHCGGFCYPAELANSETLLRRRSMEELTLFVWLWSWPALALIETFNWIVAKFKQR